jgi:hypothetical protein
MKRCYTESRKKGTSYTQQQERRLTVLVTPRVGTAFYKTLLKERKGDRSDGEIRKKT